MSKGLRALKDLYKLRAEMLEEKVCNKDSKWQENIKIYDRWGNNLIRIEKELKALEIIKEKKVNVKWLLNSYSCDDYNNWYDIHLTQEEYDLLKEVLL